MSARSATLAAFSGTAAALEAAFPGMASLSSGHASVRAEDGLCDRHGLYLSARDGCSAFAPRSSEGAERR